MAKHNHTGASADGTSPESCPGADDGAGHQDVLVHEDLPTSPADAVPLRGASMRSAASSLLNTPCMFFFGKAFTVPEVAQKLGISASQVLLHIADGTLQAVNVGRGRERRDLRVTDDHLDAFIEERKVAPAPPGAGPRATARVTVRKAKHPKAAPGPQAGNVFATRREEVLKKRGEQ